MIYRPQRIVALCVALLPAVLGGVLLTHPLPAFAQAPPSRTDVRFARELFTKAIADETAQNWEAALEKLQRAGAIKMTPGIRFHVGFCQEHLGRLVEALREYEEAERAARKENNREVLDATSEAIAKLSVRIPALKIVVQPAVEGVDVRIDGQSIAPSDAGYVQRVNPGEHSVVVQAAGSKPYRAAPRLLEGENSTLQAKLEPLVLPAIIVPATALGPAPDASSRQGFWNTGRVVSVVVFGTGLLATGTGVGFTLASQSSGRTADRLRGDLPSNSACTQPPDQNVEAACAELRDAVHTQNDRANLSVGFYVAGGTLIASSIAIWLLWPNEKAKKGNAVHVAPSIDFAGRSLGFQGTF